MTFSELRVIDVTQTTNEDAGVAALREEIRGPVEMMLRQMTADLGENLLSLSVVGSAVTDDFDAASSDINTVLVVRQRSHQLLETLAGYGKRMGKRKLRAPLLMTAEYIQSSLDVFAVEFLDFQLNHVTVYGPDPFETLTFAKADVRLQCERELKAALITLRQGYIRAMGKPKLVGGLLLECMTELAVLLRAMLWLHDTARPPQALPTVEAAAETFGFEPARLTAMMKLKLQHDRPAADQVEALFEDVYQVIDHLSRRVDQSGAAS